MERIYIVVQPGRRPARLDRLTRWARRLLPTAVLLVAPAILPTPLDGEIILSVDADEVDAGPLVLADALLRQRAPTSRQG